MSRAVIKAQDAAPPSRGRFGLELRDIARQADGLLAAARQQAERIVFEARKRGEEEIEAARRRGYEEGLNRGLAEGRESGRSAALAEARAAFAEDQKSLTAALSQFCAEFSRRREQFHVSARRDAIVLAIAIASRVVRRLQDLPEAVSDAAAEACREALALIGEATTVVVRSNPEDCAALDRLAESLSESLKGIQSLRIVADADVARGGVIIQTAEGAIDATVNGRIERIADELASDWRRRMTELGIEP